MIEPNMFKLIDKEKIENGLINLSYVPIALQEADVYHQLEGVRKERMGQGQIPNF